MLTQIIEHYQIKYWLSCFVNLLVSFQLPL